MCAGFSYASGGVLPPKSSGDHPRNLAEALVIAAKVRPHGGFTVYGGSGKVSFISYPVLLLGARRVAEGLLAVTSEGGGSIARGTHVLLAAGSPAAVELCIFWGCILSGVRPYLQAGGGNAGRPGVAAAIWESLGQPPVITAGSGAEPPAAARKIDVSDWLRGVGAGKLNGEVSSSVWHSCPSSLAFMIIATTGHAKGGSPRLYRYSHAAVMAHAHSEMAHWNSVQEGSACMTSLLWRHLAEPAVLLSHCATVLQAGDEVHAAAVVSCGEPRATLRIASRHRVGRLAAPTVFFRRALHELRRQHSDNAGSRRESLCQDSDMDLSCVQLWSVEGELAFEDAAEFLQLIDRRSRCAAGRAPAVLRSLLVSSWGSVVATGRYITDQSDAAHVAISMLPVPGVELRIIASDGCTAKRGEVGAVQARGLAVSPAATIGPSGWADVGACGCLANGHLSVAAKLPEDAPIPVAGVEYFPAEVEAAVEAAKGICPGSAIAVAARTAQGSSSDGTVHESALSAVQTADVVLAIAFVAVDPTPAAAAAAIKAVRGQLTISLGIHAQVVLPLAPSDLPRDISGQPCRTTFRLAVEAGVYLSMERDAELLPEELLPGDWVFEEEFRITPLEAAAGAAAAANAGVGAGDGAASDDGDDIEERMEGASHTAMPAFKVDGGSSAAPADDTPVTLTEPVLQEVTQVLVLGAAAPTASTAAPAGGPLSAAAVASALGSRLREKGSVVHFESACIWREPTSAAVPAGQDLSHVVHCVQCDAMPATENGSKDAAFLLCFLQAVECLRYASQSSIPPVTFKAPGPLKLVCISVGRHVRVAGDCIDPRKSLVLGLLLAAAAELPWFVPTHVDVCPSLSASTVAASAMAELFDRQTPGAAEVLLDAEGQRLVRGLRPAALLPSQAGLATRSSPSSMQPPHMNPPMRTVLLAGGAGGVGLLWAKSLHVNEMLLLGRSPAAAPRVANSLRALAGGRADVRYLCADIADYKQLESTIRDCGSASHIDLAANLCEAFSPPIALRDLRPSAFVPPAAKLHGAQNFIAALATLRRSLHSGAAVPALPVLLASSAVGLLGASRLAPYTAGARAVEAVCSHARLTGDFVDARCIAFSAWSSVGITVAYPVLAQAAPAAGLRVIRPLVGLLALEAVFQRFAVPRYGTLAVGLDAGHPRFSALIGSAGADATPSVATATLPGCIELVGGVVKKVLGREVKLGDSLVAVGLDSMTSMSMHSTLVAASGGLSLSASLFYDHPSVLEIAQLVHRLAKSTEDECAGADDSNDAEDAVEALLEDADARRSYNLGIAREALRRGALEEARERCGRASAGAAACSEGLAAARALEAEVLEKLGELDAAGAAYASALEAQEAMAGPLHPDTVIAVARQCHWAAYSVGDRVLAESLQQRVGEAHDVFFRYMSWPSVVWHPSMEQPLTTPPTGAGLLLLRSLRLDGQALMALPAELGLLQNLEALRLRRNFLAEIPASFGQLVQLREFWLTSNVLTDLPAELSSLTRLQILAVEGNRFDSLPKVICSMRRLLELGLDEQRCPMQGLTDCLLPVPVLSVLRARGCASEFPGLQPPRATGSSGGGPAAPNLNTVFWANNRLSAVPASLINFSVSLRLLDLAHNRIQELGEELFGLESLRDLSLAGNRLRVLPTAIGRMRRLQQLWLHGNLLEALPEELGELESLAILELHHNQLESLPASIGRLKKLNWLFAHGNRLRDGADLIRKLAALPRLKICGLGANYLQLAGVDLNGFRASFGLGWNEGLSPEDGVLSEALTTCDLLWDPLRPGQVQDVLVVTFSAQGAPIAQGQAEIRALRDALLPVDALYVCDPANAWFMQDPGFGWHGLEHFDRRISDVTKRYQRVFMWGGSMGGSAALLFACHADCIHAFSPQVDLAFTWPTFASEATREVFRNRIQDSVADCRGTVTVHVGEENHNDMRHASALPSKVKVHFHDTANHNTMKHVKSRHKLLPLIKLEVSKLLVSSPSQELT